MAMEIHSDRQPLVSVVVPVLNAATHIERCLNSLQELSDKIPVEIIIVDNGSNDGTRDLLCQFKDVRILDKKEPGAAHARNYGWQQAKAPYIAFTDSDCAVHPEWLNELLPELEKDEKLAGVGGTVITGSQESVVSQYIEYRKLLSAEIMAIDDWFSPPFLLTCNAIYRRSVLEEMNGISDLWPGEDADLSFRCQKAGYRIDQFPDKGIVYHYHRTSQKKLARMMRQYGAGAAEAFLKNRDLMNEAPFDGKLWIELPIYFKLMGGLIKMPLSYFEHGEFHRQRAKLDVITFGNLLLGRWSVALKKKALIL